MKTKKKLSNLWEYRQQASILCGDMELLRLINFWTRFERLECGFYSLLMSVPFVRDDFLTAHSYDSENNSFKVTTGTLGDKTIVVKLYPHEVVICPMDDQGKDFHYRIEYEDRYYNNVRSRYYQLVEIQ